MPLRQDPALHEDIARQIREGRHPEDLKGRAQLAADKLRGRAPMGVDAPNKTTRKAIGGAAKLFVVLKYGFIGALFVILGGLFTWAGCYQHFDPKTFFIGLAIVLVGLFCLYRAFSAWQLLKTIAHA